MNFEMISFHENRGESKETASGELGAYIEAAESNATETIKREKDGIIKNGKLRKLALWGILTALAIGAPEARAQEKAAVSDSTKIEQSIDQKEQLEKYLRHNEYVADSTVMEIFYQTMDLANAKEGMGAAGGFLKKNFLNTPECLENFEGGLKKLGFSGETVDSLTKIFSSKDVIILNNTLLNNERKFKEVLFHERIHEAMNDLDEKDLDSLKAGYEDVLNHAPIPANPDSNFGLTEESFLKDKLDPADIGSYGWYTVLATMNWNEFYPYLANGKFVPRVAEEIKRAHPGAYQIFEKMEQTAKVELPK